MEKPRGKKPVYNSKRAEIRYPAVIGLVLPGILMTWKKEVTYIVGVEE